jgi:hypothetical protein
VKAEGFSFPAVVIRQGGRMDHRIRNRTTAPHYRWGGDCDGWRLVEDEFIQIIEESVPPG